MRRDRLATTAAACGFALATALAHAQAETTRPVPPAATTRPVLPGAGASTPSTDALEKSAIDAFERAEYAKALPLLQDLSVRLRDDPERVAPLLEKIRVCERNVAPKTTETIEGINAPRMPHAKPTGNEPYAVELQKLGNFNYDAEKGGNIPGDVQALSGSTVKINGYMIPIDQSEKITKFVLVPSLFECCFGQPPSIQHTVVVTCPPGKAVSYYPEQIDVTGTLGVQERKDDGFITSIFEVNASSIRPKLK